VAAERAIGPGRSRNEAFVELLGRLREHADATGVALPPAILDPPRSWPGAWAHWHRVVFAYTRELLGWEVIDWFCQEWGGSWQTAATVRAAADRAERELRPGRPHDELIAEASRLTGAVCDWVLNPIRTYTDEFFRSHCDVCNTQPTPAGKEFPFAVFAAYIAAVRRHVRD
jgi:hypothetical protein